MPCRPISRRKILGKSDPLRSNPRAGCKDPFYGEVLRWGHAASLESVSPITDEAVRSLLIHRWKWVSWRTAAGVFLCS